jgi:hypothetical protein
MMMMMLMMMMMMMMLMMMMMMMLMMMMMMLMMLMMMMLHIAATCLHLLGHWGLIQIHEYGFATTQHALAKPFCPLQHQCSLADRGHTFEPVFDPTTGGQFPAPHLGTQIQVFDLSPGP